MVKHGPRVAPERRREVGRRPSGSSKSLGASHHTYPSVHSTLRFMTAAAILGVLIVGAGRAGYAGEMSVAAWEMTVDFESLLLELASSIVIIAWAAALVAYVAACAISLERYPAYVVASLGIAALSIGGLKISQSTPALEGDPYQFSEWTLNTAIIGLMISLMSGNFAETLQDYKKASWLMRRYVAVSISSLLVTLYALGGTDPSWLAGYTIVLCFLVFTFYFRAVAWLVGTVRFDLNLKSHVSSGSPAAWALSQRPGVRGALVLLSLGLLGALVNWLLWRPESRPSEFMVAMTSAVGLFWVTSTFKGGRTWISKASRLPTAGTALGLTTCLLLACLAVLHLSADAARELSAGGKQSELLSFLGVKNEWVCVSSKSELGIPTSRPALLIGANEASYVLRIKNATFRVSTQDVVLRTARGGKCAANSPRSD